MLSVNVSKKGEYLTDKRKVQHIINNSLTKTTDDSLGIIRSITPVRTGKLKAGWFKRSFREIDNNVSYAKYVNVSPRAIPDIEKRFIQNIKSEI
jgi:hypothetical protein